MLRNKGEKTEREKKPRSEKSQKALNTALYWVVLNLGMLLLAAGVYFFKGPNNFATGGVSGISIILSKYITPRVHWMSQTVIMNAINVLLLIVGFIFLGKGCTFKTVYCSLVYSLEMYAMQWIFQAAGIELSAGHTLTDQKFLEFILAMFMTGAGSAIIFNCGASSGGTDIIALILKKYTRVPIGRALLITDALIASSTFFIFDVTTGLFSVFGLIIKAFLVDSVIESIGKSKYVTIITAHPELISPFILDTIHRGFTSFEAEGGFTHEKKTVMITVLKRGEALKLKLKIHAVDPDSFVILTDAKEILGKGFRNTN
ncbi:MAG: YitT family protein [Clostridia bacterium]|nr:YitT family protein [Clostridia bacterium]